MNLRYRNTASLLRRDALVPLCLVAAFLAGTALIAAEAGDRDAKHTRYSLSLDRPAVQEPSATAVVGCPMTVLPFDGGNSGNARAPMTRYRFERSVYLIKASEMSAAGWTNGMVPAKIGWSYFTAPGISGSGPLIVYMQNTNDATNLKSTNWATAISTMTQIHNATTTLPNVLGPFDITLAGAPPFTYTGGGLYIAFDFSYPVGTLSAVAAANCNATGLVGGLLGAQSTISAPTTLTASNFRPETRLAPTTAIVLDDAAVDFAIAPGSLPNGLVGGQTLQAVIRNAGANVLSNVPVSLNVTGAQPFSDTQMVSGTAACGGTTIVNFAPFVPTTLGSNTVSVSVPSDENNSNNSNSVPMDTTINIYSYKNPGTLAAGGVGLTGATGEFLAKFTTTSATQVDSIILEFPDTVAGATYKLSVRADNGSGAPGTQIYVDAANRSVVAGAFVLRLPTPIAVGPGNFFVGVAQTATTNMGLSFNNETPVRSGAFWLSVNAGAFFDFSPGNNFKLNIGAILGSCLDPLTVDVDPPSGVVCNGDSIFFNGFHTGGTGNLSFQWTENGTDIGGETSPFLAATKPGAGVFNYNIKITDDGGCINYVDPQNSVGTWIGDGQGCDDGNGCTSGDVCSGVTCAGSPVGPPADTSGVAYSPNETTVSWSATPLATDYDVVRGMVGLLPVGPGGGDEVCFPNTGGTSITDVATPAPGVAFWYLVRGKNACATGGYGTTSNAVPRVTSTCP